MRFHLLPGLDGTGTLFRWFVERAPADTEVCVHHYDVDVHADVAQLADAVADAIPSTGEHALVAESFIYPSVYGW